jgi:hypothetical protein
MRVDSTGNVGIGTDNPISAKLEINDTSPNLAVVGSTRALMYLTDVAGNTPFFLRYSAGSNLGEIAAPSGALRFLTGGGSTGSERMRITNTGDVLVGRTSTSAAATDYGTQLYSTGVIYQYSVVTDASDIHRWYNGSGTLVATINGDGEGYFAGGATYSGTLKADEIIQDGAPVVDSLQIIRAFMKLRAATADPDSTVEELREKLKTAVDDIIDQFQDQIDAMPVPEEPSTLPAPEAPELGTMPTPETPSTLPAPERPKKKD